MQKQKQKKNTKRVTIVMNYDLFMQIEEEMRKVRPEIPSLSWMVEALLKEALDFRVIKGVVSQKK